MWLFFCRQTCTILGVIYPALASAKAAVQEDNEAYEQWMTYWIVASILALIQIFTDMTLASWLPFYLELKVFLLIWLVLPKYQGAAQLYIKVVNPWLTHYEDTIDGHLDQAQSKAARHVRRATSHVVGEIKRVVSEQGSASLGAGLNTLTALTTVAAASIQTGHKKEEPSKETPPVSSPKKGVKI
mmetsp:Transcript_163/g.247  ORF Transcript_163/g.247 Transcript_163/m.247 type:complete len:185 (-) Transcript_163:67-621(-)